MGCLLLFAEGLLARQIGADCDFVFILGTVLEHVLCGSPLILSIELLARQTSACWETFDLF